MDVFSNFSDCHFQCSYLLREDFSSFYALSFVNKTVASMEFT